MEGAIALLSFGWAITQKTIMALDSNPPISQCFHALAEPTRIQILELLRTKECCVQDMILALNVKQSYLSFHLKTLREAGLVTARKRGRHVYYRLNVDQFCVLEDYLSAY